MKKTSTREQVLALLEENSCSYISGQEIADKLYLTRAAVWKAIKALQGDGHDIEAVTNKGYRLNTPHDSLSAAAVTAMLKHEGLNMPIKIYKEIDSTNDELRRIADSGTSVEFAIAADKQLNGRGRRGRSFYSPVDTGLYMSLLIHPDLTLTGATLLTGMTAVAVMDAIKEVTGIDVSIKWVNDLYLNRLKVAGILTEAFTSIEDGSLSHVIVGIGINLYPPHKDFPKELKGTAGVLFPSGTVEKNLRNRLFAAVIKYFHKYYTAEDKSAFIEKYRAASCLIGSYVKVNTYSATEPQKYAYVTGIDDKCRLMIRYETGENDLLSGGEVSVVKY